MTPDYDQEILEGISARLASVRASIADAVRAAGRSDGEVKLIGVSKVFPVSYAEAAIASGLTDLGENRVQEIVPKIERVTELGLNVNWHLIGTLQRNKVKYLKNNISLIHSVDSVELAEEISRRSGNIGHVQDILLQVNGSCEESKHGFDADGMKEAVDLINGLDGVRLRGVMTMAMIESYEGEARAVFEKTRLLFESLRGVTKDPKMFDTLSMGMSKDYVDAIKEGSTCVRIGTAIFGDRSTVNL